MCFRKSARVSLPLLAGHGCSAAGQPGGCGARRHRFPCNRSSRRRAWQPALAPRSGAEGGVRGGNHRVVPSSVWAGASTVVPQQTVAARYGRSYGSAVRSLDREAIRTRGCAPAPREGETTQTPWSLPRTPSSRARAGPGARLRPAAGRAWAGCRREASTLVRAVAVWRQRPLDDRAEDRRGFGWCGPTVGPGDKVATINLDSITSCFDSKDAVERPVDDRAEAHRGFD